ncbi:MAG: ThiF family adenylyltransferase [Gaiellales bacterium]
MPTVVPDIEMPARAILTRGPESVRWIDVRSDRERAAHGWIDRSIRIADEDAVEAALRDDDIEIVAVICATGRRSAMHAHKLRDRGHTRAVSVAGGMAAWIAADLPVVGGDERHSRQIVLPQVGIDGQARIAAARVLIIGAGGLAAPVISYLAGAGIGTLGIVDGDRVERSNLHRQPIHSDARVGLAKVDSAAASIRELSPATNMIAHNVFLSTDNADDIVDAGWDVIVDCTDDVSARIALNTSAIRAGIPVVHGAVDQFEGRVAVFGVGDEGPCFICLYPNADPGAARSCAEAGVLGVAPGTVGMLQASEALKLVLGIESPLTRGVLVADLLTMQFTTIPLRRASNCAACGA